MRKTSGKKLLLITGPTATGKTRLSVILARRLRGEIISCDSMQIYRGMDILSQAPTKQEKALAKHYLVGSLDPVKEYSAAAFIKKAVPLIRSISGRGKVPIVVGGSTLYLKALVDGLFPSPPSDEKFRERMRGYAARQGSAKLHGRLSRIDPSAAAGIHPNDLRRIIRALEIFHTTGRTMSELKPATKGLKDEYDIRIFGLTGPRQKLYSRINSRVDRIFSSGAVRQARRLLKKRLSKTALAALGIKEIKGYLEGEYGLEDAVEMVKANTRRFAKRQLTWFRADGRIRWFDITRNSDAKIVNRISRGMH